MCMSKFTEGGSRLYILKASLNIEFWTLRWCGAEQAAGSQEN